MFQKTIGSLLVLFLLGCTQEKIIEMEIEKEVERQYQWQRQAGLDFENAVLANSYATEDHFFAMGYTQFVSMVKDSLSHPDASNGSNLAIYPKQTRLTSAVRFPLTAHYHAYAELSGTVAIVPNANPTTPGTTKYLRMPEIDPAFTRFYEAGQFALHIVRNQANQLLIPYYHSVGSNFNPRLLLVEVVWNVQEGITTMDVGQTKIIEIPRKDGLLSVSPHVLTAVNNHFYFSSTRDTYRVDANGELRVVLKEAMLTHFIPVGNTIYGMSLSTPGRGLYESTDDGKTWRGFRGSSVLPTSDLMTYTIIAGRTVTYSGFFGRIYEVSFLPDKIVYRELGNGGIEHKRITSITEFQGKVYVTTLSGLYARKVQHFFGDGS